MSFEVINLIEEGQWAVLEWKGRGTHKGLLEGHEPTGKSFELEGCGLFQVRGGLTVFQRGYWDRHKWFKQLGLPLD